MYEDVRIAAGSQFLSVGLIIIFLSFLSCISVFF
jgi:hypothetical protein